MTGYSTTSSSYLRFNNFKEGFTNSRSWGNNQSALLLSDESVDWRQANGSSTIMYFYQNSSGVPQYGSF